MRLFEELQQGLDELKERGNLRRLSQVHHTGKRIGVNGRVMLNLSSNDYLGLTCREELRKEFLEELAREKHLFTSSSSRLLTGNFAVYEQLEERLCELFGAEAALVFNSGYHANSGILPAICTADTLILADKLVHASIIDGIRLCSGKYVRYRHNDYAQLERLLEKHHGEYKHIIVVTESIFSMDGDEADLKLLVALKKKYENVYLYVDEAHAFGVRGSKGLGVAEEHDCINDIDFLVGTFGKALASMGGYIICRQVVRDYLINRMRTLIFSTALPPVTMAWTDFLLQRLPSMSAEREQLQLLGSQLRQMIVARGVSCPSTSHIVPLIVGDSSEAINKAVQLQRHGFYALPVRPPTVPEGTSRIRFSLSAAFTNLELEPLKLYL